jgi:hypothetical protein
MFVVHDGTEEEEVYFSGGRYSDESTTILRRNIQIMFRSGMMPSDYQSFQFLL